MKRVGERGEGKFERISWQQALDEIADRIKKMASQYGPESLAVWLYSSSMPPNYGWQTLLGLRFINAFGATDTQQALGIDTNPFYASFMDYGASWYAMGGDPRLFYDSKLILLWGCNPAELEPRAMRHLMEAQERGAKLVDIGLIYDATAVIADQFVPVDAGSDTALGLAMANVIISQGLYDADFLTKYTVAPLLVRKDNGMFLRESDVVAGGNPSKYVVWDELSNQAKEIDPKEESAEGLRPALRGTFYVASLQVSPAFELLCQHCNEWTPETQEAITKVPPEVVRKLAIEYATTKPAAVYFYAGMRYHNSGNAYRVINLLSALTGNTGKPGGGALATVGWGCAPPIAFNDMPIIFPDGPEKAKGRTVRNQDFFECVKTGKPYPIKGLILGAGNVLHSWPNWQRWTEETFPNLDLIVASEIFETETVKFADYVLPDTTIFERTELIEPAASHCVMLAEPAIQPVGEAKSPDFLWNELAKRLGLGDYFDKTVDEWIQLRLKSDDPSIGGIQPPLTLERLRREKIVRANLPEEPFSLLSSLKFPSDSGRIEFYSEHLADLGEPMATHREQLESPRGPKAIGYPFHFFNGRKRFFMQSIFGNDPWMIELSGKEPWVRINHQDAARYGIKDGDLVECFNDRGKVVAKARLSETIPPGTVHMHFGWWKEQMKDGHYQELIFPICSPVIADRTRERQWDIAVARYGQVFFGESAVAGTPDTMWDCLCQIRKVEGGK